MSALKMRSEVTSHQKLTTTSWEDHQSWSSYNNTRSCQRAQHQPFYSHSAFEANWKSEIAWYVGISWADCESKKSSFWSAVFFYCMQQEQTISGSDCDTQWTVHFIWQLATTSSGVGPRRSSKALPKAKKSHGHCLMACCPSDPLQLSEFWQNHYIWELCSANRWDALKMATFAASVGQQNWPNSSPQQCLTARSTAKASKVEQIGLQSYASSTISAWLLANHVPLLHASSRLFVGKMLPSPVGGRKLCARVPQIPKHRFLCYRNKQSYFSFAKMC